MNKKHFEQTEIELGKLPELLKDGRAFDALLAPVNIEHQAYVAKYRRALYKKMREILGNSAPKSSVSMKNWFSDPETHVNKAFLENERSNPQRWLVIVNAMYFSLSEVIMQATEEARNKSAFYKERDTVLSVHLEIYMKTHKK